MVGDAVFRNARNSLLTRGEVGTERGKKKAAAPWPPMHARAAQATHDKHTEHCVLRMRASTVKTLAVELLPNLLAPAPPCTPLKTASA